MTQHPAPWHSTLSKKHPGASRTHAPQHPRPAHILHPQHRPLSPQQPLARTHMVLLILEDGGVEGSLLLPLRGEVHAAGEPPGGGMAPGEGTARVAPRVPAVTPPKPVGSLLQLQPLLFHLPLQLGHGRVKALELLHHCSTHHPAQPAAQHSPGSLGAGLNPSPTFILPVSRQQDRSRTPKACVGSVQPRDGAQAPELEGVGLCWSPVHPQC